MYLNPCSHRSQVVGFVPTGWVSDMRKEAFGVRRKGSCSVHLVPYSEHSAFNELTAYVEFMRPHKVHVRSAVPCCAVWTVLCCRRFLSCSARHLLDKAGLGWAGCFWHAAGTLHAGLMSCWFTSCALWD